MRDAERSERLAAAPDLAELARRAEQAAIDLWPRGRDAEDFSASASASACCRLGSTWRSPVAASSVFVRMRQLRSTARPSSTAFRSRSTWPMRSSRSTATQPRSTASSHRSSCKRRVCTRLPTSSIAAAIAPGRGCDWIKWLPHARTSTIPCGAPHVAHSRSAAGELVRALLRVAGRRASAVDDHEPHLLVVVDAELVSDAAAVAPLLELAPAVGGSAWSGSPAARRTSHVMPGACWRSVRRAGCGPPHSDSIPSRWPSSPRHEPRRNEWHWRWRRFATSPLAIPSASPRTSRCSTCSGSACRRRTG